MSRSGYGECDDGNNWDFIKWRGQVASAIRGRRGQRLLREMLAGLDAMPVKELIAQDLQAEGRYCALGVVGAVRGIDMSELDPDDNEHVAQAFDIAYALACEVTFINDDANPWGDTPELRYARVRDWVVENLKDAD